MRRGILLVAFAVVQLVCTSCITFAYRRDIIESEPDAAIVAGFAVGATDFSDVLARLGAPIDVWEGANGGPLLAYGGLRTAEWNVDVSVPITDYGSASMSYTDTTAKTRGTVFIFDADLELQVVRSGLLADLRQTYARRRPASIDTDEEPKQP